MYIGSREGALRRVLKEIDQSFADKQTAINKKRMFLNTIEDSFMESGDKKLEKTWQTLRDECDKEEEAHQIKIGVRPDFRGK